MLYFSPIKFLVMSDYFFIITILVVLSAVFGYINVRFLKLPNSIGLMLITIVFTFGVFALSYFDSTLLDAERFIIKQIDFTKPKTISCSYHFGKNELQVLKSTFNFLAKLAASNAVLCMVDFALSNNSCVNCEIGKFKQSLIKLDKNLFLS